MNGVTVELSSKYNYYFYQPTTSFCNTTDEAAKRLEDVARKIEKLLFENKSRNTRRAERMLTDIREDLLVEVGGYKNQAYL